GRRRRRGGVAVRGRSGRRGRRRGRVDGSRAACRVAGVALPRVGRGCRRLRRVRVRGRRGLGGGRGRRGRGRPNRVVGVGGAVAAGQRRGRRRCREGGCHLQIGHAGARRLRRRRRGRRRRGARGGLGRG